MCKPVPIGRDDTLLPLGTATCMIVNRAPWNVGMNGRFYRKLKWLVVLERGRNGGVPWFVPRIRSV